MEVKKPHRSTAPGGGVLHLTLRKEPFELIRSGAKRLEYRDNTPYWATRLMDGDVPRRFELVSFRNGYRADSPKLVVKWVGTQLDLSSNKFIIQLGEF